MYETNIENKLIKVCFANEYTPKKPSRVYTIALNENKQIGLIYNSKRNIWGFPGGHTEPEETIFETAKREYIEEMGYSIKDIKIIATIISQIDENKFEEQVICLATIENKSKEYIDENETVTKKGFFDKEKVLKNIGNKELWKPLLEKIII
jgi:8-oxo-dGTP pyrophosphatase MutT (NUDIX family)